MSRPTDPPATRLWLVAPLFLLSGGTALLYQVAFGKKLATIFGATAYAVSAVLAAFMAGLALGAYLGGRFAHRVRRPLVAYGLAELAVGVVCALTPALFDAIAAAYVAIGRAAPESLLLLSAVRALLTALCVAIPTTAMGLTLPLLSRAVAGRGDDEQGSRRRLGVLYAINTGGGAAGALAGAYLVLPALGLYTTMRVAAVVNLAIGAVAMLAGRAPSGPVTRAAATAPTSARPLPRAQLLTTLAFASGLLVFAAEVIDTHLLALLIGNSAYAFGLMLAVFLTCLSVGAAMAEALERQLGERALVVSLSAAALAQLASLPIWGALPRAFLEAGHRVHSWEGREIVRALVAFAALALPTTAMGLTFPLLLRRVAAQPDVARLVGRLTAVNTVGSIAGSLATGYWILPLFGSERSLRAVAIVFAACSLLAAGRPRVTHLTLAAVTLAAAALVPPWDMKLMTNGANVYFDAQARPDALVLVREDVHGGLTSVAQRRQGDRDVVTLYTNGKFQGDNGREVVAQRSFAHFPALFARRHERALVIGLGTGTTLGTVASYPYRRIDVAEISPAIVEAARRFFGEVNRGALDDARVRVSLEDGRNVLLLATEPYDLVTIELTSVWFAGASNLYSLQFYELCRERLAHDGVLQQWIQLHHIRRSELGVVLRTLRRVFPHVALFVSGGQGIVVASAAPLHVDRPRLERLSEDPNIRATLDPSAPSLLRLLDRLALSGDDLDRFIADSEAQGGPIVSTDENLYLEYETPKGNVMSYDRSLREMVALLARYRSADALARHLR